jgi:mannose-6-phosphate isomerase-like protein (cupin superfamily)
MAMRVIRDEEQALEIWRDGVETRLYAATTLGAAQLTVFEQWCAPGMGAPAHLHAVEEVLRVLAGRAVIWVADERAECGPGASVIIPAGYAHGFSNITTGTLHVQAILAAPIFEARYLDPPRDVRRWAPEAGA